MCQLYYQNIIINKHTEWSVCLTVDISKQYKKKIINRIFFVVVLNIFIKIDLSTLNHKINYKRLTFTKSKRAHSILSLLIASRCFSS